MKNRTALTALTLGLALTAGAQTTTKTSTSRSRSVSSGYSQGGGSSSAPDQDVKDDLFAGTEMFAKNASSATEINMGPDGLGMAAGYGRHAAHNMVLNVVRTYSFDKPGLYNMADVDVYRQKVNTGDWHCSVHSRELKTGESTDICNKHRTDNMVETAIITVEPKELTFIHTIRKQDEHGDNGGEAMVEFGPMPLMAMAQEGKFAAVQAKMEADSAVMQARMGIFPMVGSDIYLTPSHGDKVITLKRQPGDAKPKELFMIQTPDGPALKSDQPLGDIKLEMKRDSSTDTPPQSFTIEIPDGVPPPPATAPAAPAAPTAPGEAPAPAVPQQ